MATGRITQLTRQIGEHLVAAKLGRLGYIATPFAGNVPDFDLLIADEAGHSMPIQVKAINGGSWQFQISKFLNVKIVDSEQFIIGEKELVNPHLVCIFVLLSEDERDDFYILRLRDLQAYFYHTYKGGSRKKNPKSLHCAILPKEIEEYKNNWSLIAETIKG